LASLAFAAILIVIAFVFLLALRFVTHGRVAHTML
jgi:hypothetical protein